MKNLVAKYIALVTVSIGLCFWAGNIMASSIISLEADVPTYSLPGPGFGFANGVDRNLNPLGVLGTSQLDPFGHRGPISIADRGMLPWVHFDVSSLSLSPGASVIFSIYAINPLDLGITAVGNPSTADPVTVQLYAAGGPWDYTTLTWNNQSNPFGLLLGEITQAVVNRWYPFDVISKYRLGSTEIQTMD